MPTLVLASNNAKKVRELQQILAPLNWDIKTQQDYQLESVEETGLTFVENAIFKARHAALNTGLPALADDSGLEVDALNGRPGIYSSRYAGEDATDDDNNRKLLEELADVPETERTARFHAVLVFMRHAQDPCPLIAHGIWEGRILFEAEGENGFGYDPLFYALDQQCSSAALPAEMKNKVSHRAKALQQLKQLLVDHV